MALGGLARHNAGSPQHSITQVRILPEEMHYADGAYCQWGIGGFFGGCAALGRATNTGDGGSAKWDSFIPPEPSFRF